MCQKFSGKTAFGSQFGEIKETDVKCGRFEKLNVSAIQKKKRAKADQNIQMLADFIDDKRAGNSNDNAQQYVDLPKKELPESGVF